MRRYELLVNGILCLGFVILLSGFSLAFANWLAHGNIFVIGLGLVMMWAGWTILDPPDSWADWLKKRRTNSF